MATIASTMQDDYQLTIQTILRHGAAVYGDSECVTWTGTGSAPRRASYRQLAANAGRLAAAFTRLGLRAGDRVGTFCWNHQEHLEVYYAVPCAGAVLHTLNIRLPARQLAHIANHAQDRFIVVDASLIGLLAPVVDDLAGVEAFIVVGEGDTSALGARPVYRYDQLLAAEQPDFAWPELDERSAATMCYTSGTTGDPKGVVYSHRSVVLHAMGGNSASLLGATEADRVLAIVPMFHVNAWGVPFGALLSGATLHMPGPFMMPEQIVAFIEAERTTIAAAVPTIWGGIEQVARTRAVDLSSLRLGTSGGAAMPRSLQEAMQRRHGVRIIQGWGMTETSPIGGMAYPPLGIEPGSDAEFDWRQRSGRVAAGVEMRIVGDDGAPLPADGESVGEIEVRGPWITASYHLDAAPEKFDDGWLRTGDIGWLDQRGFFQITDRSKDVIKSGGEWISSVELENLLAGNPDVLEAAVIAIPDERWTERPLACVVTKPGADVDPAQLAGFLDGQVAAWQVPENWAFIDEVPKTTVGKFDKKVLRARYAAGELHIDRTKP